MMRRALRLTLAALACVTTLRLATAQNKPPMPAQAQRGHELFLKSAKGIACATCHALAGEGTAVGPDLTQITSVVTPRGLVKTIQMTITQNVQQVKTATGAFPAVQKQKQGDDYEIWDLSQTPPVLRKLTSKEILSMARDEHWGHPPATAEYTSQELADIIGYLRWVAIKSRTEIKAAEIE